MRSSWDAVGHPSRHLWVWGASSRGRVLSTRFLKFLLSFNTLASSFSCRAGLTSCRSQWLRFLFPKCKVHEVSWTAASSLWNSATKVAQQPLGCCSVKGLKMSACRPFSSGRKRSGPSGCCVRHVCGRAPAGFTAHPLHFEDSAVVRAMPGSSCLTRSCSESKKKQTGEPASSCLSLQRLYE